MERTKIVGNPNRRFARKQKAGQPDTVLCSICKQRKSSKNAIYVRRNGYAHKDPICAGC